MAAVVRAALVAADTAAAAVGAQAADTAATAATALVVTDDLVVLAARVARLAVKP